MRTIGHIMHFEWKALWRSHVLKVLLLVVLGAGLYSIYFGKYEIEKQTARVLQVEQYERQQFDSLLAWAKLDTTKAFNKKKFEQATSPTGVGWSKHFTYYVGHEAPPMAGLCLGQRDLYPIYYGFNVTDLARQVNTGELANPMKLLTGNFDLSYVFVFLFPLLIVALFYGLYADEKEKGTLSLLQSQSIPLVKVLIGKGLLRLFIVLGMATILLFLGFLIQGVSITSNASLLIQWLLVIYGYCLFWTLILGFLICCKLSATLSGMLGLGVWLTFTLIIPSVINLFVLAKTPLPNRADMIHVVRNMNDKAWESPKSFVLDQFYNNHPEYNDGDTVNFHKWYYASFTLFDKEANALKSQYEEVVRTRNASIEKWGWLAPAAMVHGRLSRVSDTDRLSHQDFISEMEGLHKELKNLYYDRIFAGSKFSIEDLMTLEQKL